MRGHPNAATTAEPSEISPHKTVAATISASLLPPFPTTADSLLAQSADFRYVRIRAMFPDCRDLRHQG